MHYGNICPLVPRKRSPFTTKKTLRPEAAIWRTNSRPIPDHAPVISAHGPNRFLFSVCITAVSLTRDANRFNALLGAGQAAEGLGKRDVAAGNYQTLFENCTNGDGRALAVLSHPRAVVQGRMFQKLTGAVSPHPD
jgi:hypothetical protein